MVRLIPASFLAESPPRMYVCVCAKDVLSPNEPHGLDEKDEDGRPMREEVSILQQQQQQL